MSRSSLQLSLFILKGKTFSYWIFKPQHVSVCVKDIQKLFFLNGPFPASFLFIFVPFSLQFQYKLKKPQMVCLGFEPGAAMVGTDETTELWRQYSKIITCLGLGKSCNHRKCHKNASLKTTKLHWSCVPPNRYCNLDFMKRQIYEFLPKFTLKSPEITVHGKQQQQFQMDSNILNTIT